MVEFEVCGWRCPPTPKRVRNEARGEEGNLGSWGMERESVQEGDGRGGGCKTQKVVFQKPGGSSEK